MHKTRLKQPPPPLPKLPSSTPPKTVQKVPSMTRTPPPLPKTPPRGSVKKSTQQVSTDSPEKQTSFEQSEDVLNQKHTETDDLENTNEISKNIDSQSNIDTNTNESCEADNQKSKFVDIKSRFNGSVENVAPEKPLPKIPLKPPKIKPLDKSKHKSEIVETTTVEDLEIKRGNSVWFVNTDSPDTDDCKPDKQCEVETETADKNAEIQIISRQQESIKYNKKISPLPSPKPLKKPLPKPPPKVKPNQSPECVTRKGGSVDSDNDKTANPACDKNADTADSENMVVHSVRDTQITDEKSGVNVVNSSSFSDINGARDTGNVPIPIPRKPVPVARPRPAPRKRVTVNRNSGNEDSFSESQVSTNKASNIPDKSNDCDTNKLAKDFASGEEVDSMQEEVVTRRVVQTETGEDEYKVIDRSSVRSGSHITELEEDNNADDNEVILRKKVVRESNFDIQDVPSVEELQFIFSGSDDEVANDSNASDACLSKDYEFGDKFLKFAEKDVKDSNTKKSESCENTKKNESFEDMISDKSILEPSSLLNEIEDILTRSFKHSSLTRSGSSPEKKTSPYLTADEQFRSERSRSVDNSEGTPVRPPRPKKEQRRLRSKSQISYDSCGSDTESLPDLGRARLDSQSSTASSTLGKARPHPPKPKRHKLLKVQRSQSDVTAMRSVVDKLEDNDNSSPNHRNLTAEFSSGGCDVSGSPVSGAKGRPETLRKNRPTRKAPPPPPGPPLKVTPPSPSVDLSTVIPVDERVKSMNLGRQSQTSKDVKHDSKGLPYYHSIKDDDADSSECDHDYQDIPDSETHAKSAHKGKSGKLASPPKLPPRNLNNSHSFDTSSLSSAGHELGVASSAEDVSVSIEVTSPGFKQPRIQSFPKTSSPFVKGGQNHGLKSVEGSSNLSLASSVGDRSLRPVSGCSIVSDSWSGSQEVGQSSTSESEPEDEEQVRADYCLLYCSMV